MSRIDTVVRGVVLASVQTRKVGANETTLWEATTPDGTKWVTFKAALGNKASALIGQPVDIDGTIEQKDDSNYVNYYLNKIQPSKPGGVVEAAANAAAAQPTGNQEVSFEKFATIQREGTQASEKAQLQREMSIHRQVATKVAATLVGAGETPEDFWANVEDLLAFYQTGLVPTAHASGQPMTVTSHSGEEVVDVVPDQDIPF